jgi:LPXTG-motif cell wall-anchored protein
MTNSYGNLVTVAIGGETRLVAPPTGSSTASAMTFSGLLTAGFIAFRKRRELMSLIFV